MSSHRRWMLVAATALVANLVLATAVIAGHRFGDVPNSNIFHNDITRLADNQITRGCNPPANTLFCPKDTVTREQMAAFMRRIPQAFGANQSVATTSVNIAPGPDLTEVLTLAVAPRHEVNVVLNASMVVAKLGTDFGAGRVSIHRGSCEGPQIGAQMVYGTGEEETFTPPRTTVAVTGMDSVSTPTTYSLCVGAGVTSVRAQSRAMTAFWAPAG